MCNYGLKIIMGAKTTAYVGSVMPSQCSPHFNHCEFYQDHVNSGYGLNWISVGIFNIHQWFSDMAE